MSSSSHQTTLLQSTSDTCEASPTSVPPTTRNAESPAYPQPVHRPQPIYPRQSTETTLVNRDLSGIHKGKLTFQESCHGIAEEYSTVPAIHARAVGVAVGDNRSPSEVSDGGQFFPDRRLASSPKPDENSRPLCPRRPHDGDRYRRTRTHPQETILKLTRGPRPIVQEKRIPDGWEEDVHPEGQLLYSTVITARQLHIRVHTDCALRRRQNHSLITRAVEMLSKLANECNELHLHELEDSDIEACIMIRDQAPDEFGYYLVNHRDQTVFWLEDIDHDSIEGMNLASSNLDILGLRLKTLYWRYVTDFPCHCSLSSKVWEQLSPLILVGAVDQEYCEDSTAPRDAATLARLETFWRQAKAQRDLDSTRPTCNWICARIWFDLITPRIINHWGTDHARLERTTKLEGDETPSENAAPRLIQWLCILLLWNEPAVTMKLLDEAWLGGIIYQRPWRKMMEGFSNEWEKIFVLSAIIFAGAMAFLAIPVQNSTGPINTSNELVTSFAFLCGVLCCVFSVASLIAAVNLKRDFGGAITDDVHEARAYLESLNGGVMGYLKWGICLSLPRALFQWAVVSFCAGLVILAWQLHEKSLQFFYAEVAVSVVLAVGVVAVRHLSPERIRPESIFRIRRTARATKKTVSLVTKRVTKRATTLFSDWSRQGKGTSETSAVEAGLALSLRSTRDHTSMTSLINVGR